MLLRAQPPAWLKRASGKPPALDFDFANDRYYIAGAQATAKSLWSFTRATTAWYDRGDGVWVQAASGELRRGRHGIANQEVGYISEPARTNLVLWNRDMTDASWVKTTMTAAKDQVGIDGVTNSASSLTATAGNALCLQTIVSASASRRQSAFVRRLTGSGTIQMTGDGSVFTTITLTTAWTQLPIPTATVTNPIVGFKIVTSGDAIAVDMVQNEAVGALADQSTTPIDTTTASVTRNADVLFLLTTSAPFFSGHAGASAIYSEACYQAPAAAGTNSVFTLSDNTANNRLMHRASTTAMQLVVTDTSVAQAAVNSATLVAGKHRMASSWQDNNFVHCGSVALNAATFGTDDVSGIVPTTTRFEFGCLASTNNLCGTLVRATYWNCQNSPFGRGDLQNLVERSS